MKRLKRIMALVIAMAMVVAMALPAFGASITLKSDDTHTYKVFQVLTGTLAEEGSYIDNTGGLESRTASYLHTRTRGCRC